MREIWGIKNCQSVKKALSFLQDKNIAYEFVDYKKTPPSLEKLKEWIEKRGIEKVLNKKGLTYKALNLKDQNLTQSQLIEIMQKNPTLIKRPVLVDGEILEFGFEEAEYERLF